MIKVNIENSHQFPLSASDLKVRVEKFLLEKKRQKDIEVDVAIINTSEMVTLAKTYLKETGSVPHNVLSFPSYETTLKFVSPPSDIRNIGQVAVCYEKAKEEAVSSGKNVEDWIGELIEHGILHLLGEHHD